MKSKLFVLAFCLSISISWGQGANYGGGVISEKKVTMTRPWEKIHTVNRKKPIPYTPVREADVVWSKRVWRYIDVKEKLNLPLYFPKKPMRDRKSLGSILIDAVTNFDTTDNSRILHAYTDEDLKVSYRSIDEVKKNLRYEYSDDSLTSTGTITVQKKVTVQAEDIVRYGIIEDWFFDKRRSQLDVRIYAIYPLYLRKESINGTVQYSSAPTPLFYIYFPEVRQYLVNNECYNPQNDAEWRNFDEIFAKRRFSSYIVKVENVYDRMISQYATGLDALLESERIKNEIFQFEQDLWEY